MNFNSYDYIIFAFSGGKDSTACVLHLLESGAPKERMQLWHHEIDGREGGRFMDWAVTPDYCRKFAQALGIPIYFSWKVGGFKREMLRKNQLSAPVMFEALDGAVKKAGGLRGKMGTRHKFPQISPDLRVRWCTAYLKIDVGKLALTNQEEFIGKRILFITGERAEESAGRAKYSTFEPHARDKRDGKKIKRHIDHYRPIHSWKEEAVWAILRRWAIKPHPCYYLGWGRCSCAGCIFGNKNQWASLSVVDPAQISMIINYEKQFGLTINRTKSIPELIESGTPYKDVKDKWNRKLILSREYYDDVIMEDWKLPSGAFGENAGPS